MRDFFKQNAPGLAGVLLGGLLGLFLLLFPQTTANIVFFIFGTALIVAGVVHAILYFADDARNAIGGSWRRELCSYWPASRFSCWQTR